MATFLAFGVGLVCGFLFLIIPDYDETKKKLRESENEEFRRRMCKQNGLSES